MPIINVPNPRNFPNRPMKDFRGSPDQAEKLHPGNTIYVFHQATGGTIVMIDTGAPATDPEPEPIYQEEPAPGYVCSNCGKPVSAAEADDNGGMCEECADPQPEPTPTKRLGNVLDTLQLKF
jgi:hypothetical protein